MKSYQALTSTLVDEGVDSIFGLMGDANMHYLAHFIDSLGKRFVGCTHEAGAVAMADGFHRASGDLAVASVTHGPGFTNTVTSIVTAVRYGSQILILTGDAPYERTYAQRIDIAAVVAPTGAGYERVHRSDTVIADVRRAIHRVRTERRPVVLNFPSDLMNGDTDEVQGPGPMITMASRSEPDADALDRALGLIATAKHPLILAGRGAVEADAAPEIKALADLLGAPVSTSLLGMDLFRDHPLDLGIYGSLASGLASEVIAAADCVIAFGASLNRYTAFMGELFQGKRVVHCDISPVDVGVFTPVDVAVIGDAKVVARRMTEALASADLKAGRWGQRYTERIAKWRPSDEFADESGPQTVDARTAAIRLDELLPAERRIVSDVGRFHIVWRYLHVATPGCFTHTSSFGSIGLGLANAIGAAIADPSRLTVALIGDGGFMMNATELSTAVRNHVPLLVVILNDSAYGAEYVKLADFGDDPKHSIINWPDFGELAVAMGARAHTARSVSDLDAIPQLIDELDGPCVVDIKIDPAVDIGYH